jgi:hypothetical protein
MSFRFIYSQADQDAAYATALLASAGTRRNAFLVHWRDVRLGATFPKTLRVTRDGVTVYTGTIASLPIVTVGADLAFVMPAATQLTISAADIDSGYWELRVEHPSDATRYFGCVLTRGGGDEAGSLNADLGGSDTLAIGSVVFRAPASLDASSSPIVQTSAAVAQASGASLVLTLANQPTPGNKIVVDFAFTAGTTTAFDPATGLLSAERRLWLDPNDLSTLFQNTAGTTAVTAAGQTVRRWNNKGSLGGYLENSTGWALATNDAGGYELAANPTQATGAAGGSVFASNGFDWDDVLPSVGGGELNVAFRADTSSNPGNNDHWYSRNVFMLGDARGGMAVHTSVLMKAYNHDGAADAVSLTHVEGANQLGTWYRGGGFLQGNISSGATLSAGVATGDTTGTTTQNFSLGGPWHLGGGSWPLFQGRIGAIIAGAALDTNKRASVKSYLGGAQNPNQPAGSLTVTDNSGRAHSYFYPSDAISADGAMQAYRAVLHTTNSKEGAASSEDFVVTVALPGGNGAAAGVAYELTGLQGAASVDTATLRESEVAATTGAMTLSTAALAQPTLVAASVFVKNADGTLNLNLPSTFTSIGLANVGTTMGLRSAVKTVSDGTAQTYAQTWDSGSAGTALGLLTGFRLGTNVDPLPGNTNTDGGTSTAGIALSVADIQSDVQLQSVQQHDYLPAVVPSGYDWYLGWRGRDSNGDGIKQELPLPNPPAGFSAQVGWGEFFTDKDNAPGVHNWGIQIMRLVTLELRGGVWGITRSVTQAQEMAGTRFTNYNPQTSAPITTRVNAQGLWEIFMPNEGGVFHFWEEPRSQIVGTGASDRACVIVAKLVVWNPAVASDLASARVTCHAGIDFWRTTSAPFLQDYSNNSDMGISRARIIPTAGTPAAYTVTADCRDSGRATTLRAALVSLGII